MSTKINAIDGKRLKWVRSFNVGKSINKNYSLVHEFDFPIIIGTYYLSIFT